MISVIIPKLINSFTMLFNNLTNYVSQLTYMANEIFNSNIDYDASTSAYGSRSLLYIDWKTMVSSIGG